MVANPGDATLVSRVTFPQSVVPMHFKNGISLRLRIKRHISGLVMHLTGGIVLSFPDEDIL